MDWKVTQHQQIAQFRLFPTLIVAWLQFPHCSSCGWRVKTSLCFGEVFLGLFAFQGNLSPQVMPLFLKRTVELSLFSFWAIPWEKKRTPLFSTSLQKVISSKAEMPWELGAHATFDKFGSWEAHNCLFRTSDLFWPACTYGHTHE